MPLTWRERKARIGTPTTAERNRNGEGVGFITARQQWEVAVTFPKHIDNCSGEVRTTSNKRDARRSYDMLVKHSQHPIGKYSGCSVRLSCDGETIAEYKP